MAKKENNTDYRGEVTIAGRPYELFLDKKTNGGEFYCWGKKRHGKGQIYVENAKDLRTVVEILLHEVMEATLVEENKRYSVASVDQGNANRVFIFTHEYYETFCPKVLNSLLESGFVQLVDRRK